MDALTYRLNHAYLSGSTGHSEVETSLVMRLARPISESSIYYREEGSHEAAALSALFDFSLGSRTNLPWPKPANLRPGFFTLPEMSGISPGLAVCWKQIRQKSTQPSWSALTPNPTA